MVSLEMQKLRFRGKMTYLDWNFLCWNRDANLDCLTPEQREVGANAVKKLQ